LDWNERRRASRRPPPHPRLRRLAAAGLRTDGGSRAPPSDVGAGRRRARSEARRAARKAPRARAAAPLTAPRPRRNQQIGGVRTGAAPDAPTRVRGHLGTPRVPRDGGPKPSNRPRAFVASRPGLAGGNKRRKARSRTL